MKHEQNHCLAEYELLLTKENIYIQAKPADSQIARNFVVSPILLSLSFLHVDVAPELYREKVQVACAGLVFMHIHLLSADSPHFLIKELTLSRAISYP